MRHNFWLNLALCFSAAILVAVIILTLLPPRSEALANSDQAAAPGSEVFSGVITDSFCGARHTRFPNLDAVRCTRECVRTGGKYTLINGDTVYTLKGDFAELAQFAGQRARVTGTLEGQTIRIASINSPQQ